MILVEVEQLDGSGTSPIEFGIAYFVIKKSLSSPLRFPLGFNWIEKLWSSPLALHVSVKLKLLPFPSTVPVFLENDVVAVLTVIDFGYFITCQCGIVIVVILPVTGAIGVAPVPCLSAGENFVHIVFLVTSGQ